MKFSAKTPPKPPRLFCISASSQPFGVQFHFSDATSDEFLQYSSSHSHTFELGQHEHVVLLRCNVLQSDVVGVQFQTSLGRRSPFYGQVHEGTREERLCEPDMQIVGVTHEGFKTALVPSKPPKPLLSLLVLSPQVRRLVSKSAPTTRRSVLGHSLARGGAGSIVSQSVKLGMAFKVLRKNAKDGDSILRLVLEGENGAKGASGEQGADDSGVQVPKSLLRALAECPSKFDHSIVDLMFAGHPDSIFSAYFAGGSKSVSSLSFARRDPCSIAYLVFFQDRVRGLRSIMQLVTDEEALNDPANPSLMRMTLNGEQDLSRPSVHRLAMLKRRTATNVMEELLARDQTEDSLARRLLSEPQGLLRLNLTETPSGKPALAKFVFGGDDGAHSSLARLVLQDEAGERAQASLLRLLLARTNGNRSVLDLMTARSAAALSAAPPCLPQSLLDIVYAGETHVAESSLARIVLSMTVKIEGGRIHLAKTLASDPQGLTLARAVHAGEELGGPGISLMRMFLLGEDEAAGQSVLRLLMTGEEAAEDVVSPLRVIFAGFHAAFVARRASAEAKSPTWTEASKKFVQAVHTSFYDAQAEGGPGTWKQSFHQLLTAVKDVTLDQSLGHAAFLWKAAQLMRSYGPEFAGKWEAAWRRVGEAIVQTSQPLPEGSHWKAWAPQGLVLAQHIGSQDWHKAVVQGAVLLSMVESKNRAWMGKFSQWVPAFGC